MAKNADKLLERWLRERLSQRLATGSTQLAVTAIGSESASGPSTQIGTTASIEGLLQEVSSHSGAADLFVQPATLPAIADFGVLAYAVASATQLLSAVEVALTHPLFSSSLARLSVVTATSNAEDAAGPSATQVSLRHELLRPMVEPAAAALVDETLASFLGLLRWRAKYHAGVQLRVLQVGLARGNARAPVAGMSSQATADFHGASAEAYERHFGVTPMAEARRTELTIECTPSAAGEQSEEPADGIVALLGTNTARLYADTQQLEGMGGALIRTLIGTFGRVGKADRAAAALRTSERTMRRRLSQENTSFQRILDRYRAALAQDYLRETSLSTQQMGELLGFTEATNFRRAFLRWSGRSPHDYRSSLKSNLEPTSAGQT